MNWLAAYEEQTVDKMSEYDRFIIVPLNIKKAFVHWIL